MTRAVLKQAFVVMYAKKRDVREVDFRRPLVNVVEFTGFTGYRLESQIDDIAWKKANKLVLSTVGTN